MASHDRDLHARGPVRIGVGYGWDNERRVLSDEQWTALRNLVTRGSTTNYGMNS